MHRPLPLSVADGDLYRSTHCCSGAGAEVPRRRQVDLMVRHLLYQNGPAIQRLYDQMLVSKWVIFLWAPAPTRSMYDIHSVLISSSRWMCISPRPSAASGSVYAGVDAAADWQRAVRLAGGV